MYKTQIEVCLRPVGTPTVLVGIDKTTRHMLEKETWFVFDFDQISGHTQLVVEMIDKMDSDPTTAVEIVEVRINGISNPKFAWAGVYRPVYPEPWASTQTNLAQSISPATYLGWNGVWQLDLTVPAFTWIHQLLGLGWIFE
jgi:hypothetical protein